MVLVENLIVRNGPQACAVKKLSEYVMTMNETPAARSAGAALQPADIGWPTGNGKKLSCSQAQLGQATCLAAA